MTEISTIFDPSGFERAQRAEDARIAEALGITAVATEAINIRQLRRESTLNSALEGLKMVAKHIGAGSLKETAQLVGIELPEDQSGTAG